VLTSFTDPATDDDSGDEACTPSDTGVPDPTVGTAPPTTSSPTVQNPENAASSSFGKASIGIFGGIIAALLLL
jgi:hypothetical protein